jgi:hypothetical protein
MTGLLARAASLVVEPRTDSTPAIGPTPTRALVLGSPSAAPPVAAALAGSLRVNDRASAALLCMWCPAGPGPAPDPDLALSYPTAFTSPALTASPASTATPASAARLAAAGPGDSAPLVVSSGDAPGESSAPRPSHTPASAPLAAWASAGARRLAARLSARGLTARATGRLAWLTLPDEAPDAARLVGGLLGWLDAPVVTAVAGPRSDELDGLLAAHDLVVAVRPPAGGISSAGREMLAALALHGLPGPASRAVACDPLPGGVARWRARAGLARLPAGHPVDEALLPAPRSVVA